MLLMIIELTDQVAHIVEDCAKSLGIEAEKFVNDFLFMYVEDHPDIKKCPKCNKPVVWPNLIPLDDGEDEIECPHCGNKCIMNWDNYVLK